MQTPGEIMKRIVRYPYLITAALAAAVALTACSSDADVANENIKKQAENFEITRRVVAVNTITGEYILEVKGLCSLEWPERRADIICKLSTGQYVKHTVHLSDNTTVFSEQTNGTTVSTDRYEVNFKPQALVPNVEKR
jgi:hypothetical protein